MAPKSEMKFQLRGIWVLTQMAPKGFEPSTPGFLRFPSEAKRGNPFQCQKGRCVGGNLGFLHKSPVL